MRKLFAIALVALLLGVGVVAVIETDPGYVLVSYANYTLEASLWVGLLLLLLSVLLIYLLVQLTYWIVGGRRSLVSWLEARKVRNALRLTTRGLISFTEGNWLTARRQALRGAQHSAGPLLNYLLAARASARLHDTEKVHAYLRAAGDAEPGAVVAVEIALAEIKLQSGEYQQAVTALDEATHNVSRHPHVLSLLCQAYQGLKDWDKVLELLPQLQKHKLLKTEEFEQLQHQVHRHRLAAEHVDLQQLRASWQQVPKPLQRDAGLVEAYVANLIRLKDDEAAENALLGALKQEWSTTLVRQYGYVQGRDVARQLSRAENWLASHPADPQLFLCLGRLSAHNKLWGKAREYFQSSYRLQRSPEICAELGRLLTALGEAAVGTAYFREGLLLHEESLPELPMPDKTIADSRLLARL